MNNNISGFQNKKEGLVIVDSGPIFSLALIDRLDILNELFNDVRISEAVWNEIIYDETEPDYSTLFHFFKHKTCQLKRLDESTIMASDGESESFALYKELQADFLLIDDKKTRKMAESLGINCIGLIGLLSIAKDKRLIKMLKPVFETLVEHKRLYPVELLNAVLAAHGERIFL
jgi:uncharacterized protein